MPIEAALIKPVVDALLALFRQGSDIQLKRNAEAALREAIRELLMANPDENRAEARIAIARAAGILTETSCLRDMLKKHRATKSRTAASRPRAQRKRRGRRVLPANAARTQGGSGKHPRKRRRARRARGASPQPGRRAAKNRPRRRTPRPGKPARPAPKG